MMETILLNVLLLLGVLWMTLGIAYFWKLMKASSSSPQNEEEKETKPRVTPEQIERANHVLVGRSKPFVPSILPEVPAVSPSENSAENPNTFARQNAHEEQTVPDATAQNTETEAHEEASENEMQVNYTMDEEDEDISLREELQLKIADEALPEADHTSVLSRDLVRISRWSNKDELLDTEDNADVQKTLQALRGTQLMDYLKEATLRQEQKHLKFLAAIDQMEEASETREKEVKTTSELTPTENEAGRESIEGNKPLSFYLNT